MIKLVSISFFVFLCLTSFKKKDHIPEWWLCNNDSIIAKSSSIDHYNVVNFNKFSPVISYFGFLNIKYQCCGCCEQCKISIRFKNIKDSLLYECNNYGSRTPIYFPSNLPFWNNKEKVCKIYFTEDWGLKEIEERQIFEFVR